MGACGNVCCVVVVVEDSVLSLDVFKYGVRLCKECDECCVFVRRGAVGISVGDMQVSPFSMARDLGVVLTSISLFMIILVAFASLLIFTCMASD